MARNGSGTYSLPAGNPVSTGTPISSTWANTTLNDIASSLTASIAYDGQTSPIGNLPMAGYNHTNVGVATTRTNYAQAGQVQDGAYSTLSSVSGTDTITATASLAVNAYAAGQYFNFVSAGANTTSSVTLNINGIGAKNITKNGSTALSAGDISSGQMISVIYDGTQFQLQTAALGVTAFSGGTTGLTPSSLTKGSVTLAGVLGQLNGGTGALTASITFVNRTSNVVTITTSSAHGFVAGDYVTVAAVTNTGFNGNFTIATAGTTTFTYAQTASNVGTTADTGTVTDLSYVNLAKNVTGILYPNFGGLGTTTLNTGALVVGNGTSAATTIAPVSTGQKLIVTSSGSVTAGSFVVGASYTITAVGTTSFTSIGASANTVGISFTATGVGSGTGTATLNSWTAGSGLTSGTTVSTTSGTSAVISNIPSWAKRITVLINGVTTSLASLVMTFNSVATGYSWTQSRLNATGTVTQSNASDTSFQLIQNALSASAGKYTITLANASTYSYILEGSTQTSTNYQLVTGRLVVGAVLSSITFSGVTFSAGEIDVIYE